MFDLLIRNGLVMTSFPAQRLGLRDRGMLRDGMKADIVIFDPKTVKAPATPKHPTQYPPGIPYVIVNGKVVVDEASTRARCPGARSGTVVERRTAMSDYLTRLARLAAGTTFATLAVAEELGVDGRRVIEAPVGRHRI